MRELKFRAWDKAKKKMLFGVSPFVIDVWGSNESLFAEPHKRENCIFEQYTGLKDKNGKEIYEGDIVDYNDDGECIGYVVYNAPSYEIMEKTGYSCWLKGAPHQRVIGNIHENPELFKEINRI